MIAVEGLTLYELGVVHDFLGDNRERFEDMCREAGVDADKVYDRVGGAKEAATQAQADHDYRTGRLHNKYTVAKTDGTPVAAGATYFVLRVDTDPHAFDAVYDYSQYVEEDNPEFAKEIRAMLRGLHAHEA